MIDLHTHSTFSDGSLTPGALVDAACSAGAEAAIAEGVLRVSFDFFEFAVFDGGDGTTSPKANITIRWDRLDFFLRGR